MSVTETKPPQGALLQLKTEQRPEGEVDATIPVRWCIQPALIEELKQRGFKKPELLLIVRTALRITHSEDYTEVIWTDTSRVILPLDQELQYISFMRPGANQVVAYILDMSKAKKPFFEHVLAGGKGDYNVSSLAWEDGTFPSNLEGVPVMDVSSTLDVEVPAEMFAPPDAEWAKTLVNRFFFTKPLNQCHFKWRLMGSVAWLPFFMFFGTLFKIGSFVVASFCGLRMHKTGIASLWHPFSGQWAAIWTDSEESSIWFHKKKKNDQRHSRRREFPAPTIMLNPFTLLSLPAIVFAIGQLTEQVGQGEQEHTVKLISWGWWQTVLIVDGLLLGLVTLILAINGIGFGLLALRDKLTDNPVQRAKRDEKFKKKQSKEDARQRTTQEAILHELESMVCGPMNSGVSIEALREDKQTMRLRISRYKSRHCRPYARSS